MARNTKIGRAMNLKSHIANLSLRSRTARLSMQLRRGQHQHGFTFLELLIVMTIMAIMVSVAVPVFLKNIKHARETRLQHDLFIMREAIDKYTVDKEQAPATLQDLVT